MRAFAVVAFLSLLVLAASPRRVVSAPSVPSTPTDEFTHALHEMGISAKDLGYRPREDWARYPKPSTIPYMLPFFQDLLAHPLDTYPFTRTLGNAVEKWLTPEGLRGKEPEALFELGISLGTDRMIGSFRGFHGSANLAPHPDKKAPLKDALVRLFSLSGTPLTPEMSFGQAGDDPVDGIEKQVAKVPEALRLPLADLLLNLEDAKHWIDLGLRRVPASLRESVFRILGDLGPASPDGSTYFPQIDDVARDLDRDSLYYGSLKALQAVQDARVAIGKLHAPKGGWPKFSLRLSTHWGTVVFDREPMAKDAPVEDPLLVVRFGGDLGPEAGATGPRRPLSVALLFGHGAHVGIPGKDSTEFHRDVIGSTGCGVLGCGIVYSAGDGDDVYSAGRWGLGAGLFGLGCLVDEGGNDRYEMDEAGLGTGYLGVGLLLDAAGNDHYVLREGDGEGLGFPGGVGVLADRSGDDHYYAEPDAAKAGNGRGDYHSAGKIAVSNAQGVGSGRRGDGSDGHCYAGGLGALLDVEGNDTYQAGNFSQGLGYWYGTGLLWDGGGDDHYTSVYFTQGSGAHFSVGALIDEGGNDVHVLRDNAGAGFAFGWDVVNAFLIDRGDGNDRYVGKIISTGEAEVRSEAFFLDEGGDDVYVLNEGQKGFGDVDVRKSYTKPPKTYTYPFLLPQVGMFLDLGGHDTYLRRKKDGSLVPDARAGDDRTWHLRRAVPGALGGFNVSIGMDVARGEIGFLDPWPRRSEAGK